ncbi:MAG: hypothetical protein LBC92_04865 [Rickettsiales bacterium]|jgi:hypothetical protein|nr:hypothetical protein [Rickettsiales bacterium]
MYKTLKEIAEIKLGYSLRERITPDSNGNVYLLTPASLSLSGNIYLNNARK